jgi:glyoxylase-like metal-dependent hydrolase (beta-lactamase superfamily II)
MSDKTFAADLTFPFPVPPEPIQSIEIAPGLVWVRFRLPFRLDHINVYLVEDGPGWAVIDTGLGDEATALAWDTLLAGPLSGRRLTRLIVTHSHPDHVGSAGWLSRRFDLPIDMSQTEYLITEHIARNPSALEAEHYRRFYREHGLDEVGTQSVVTRGHAYLRMITPLPPTFRRLIAGEKLQIGAREFSVMTAGGHSAEQVMLYCRAERLFFGADQVLARISPNVSVWAVDPDGDPLGIYLRSLDQLKSDLPEDVLVLPGHNLPFYGLHGRVDELKHHHEMRCAAIQQMCHVSPRSAAELVPEIFRGKLGPHEMGFAFSEILSHINYMLRQNRLVWVEGGGPIRRVKSQ